VVLEERQKMTPRSSLLTAAAAALVAVGLIPRLHADEWNKRTVVTLSEPLIAGNKVLQPGTYVWKLMDSPVNRNIVRIYNDSGSKLETTVLATPNYRLQRSDKDQFVFWETPAGVPKAVRAWFYPGDNVGQEFPYPKKLIAQLASTQPVPIPASYNPPAAASEPQPAAAPISQPVQTASAEPVPAPVPAPAAQPAPEKQPAPAAEPRALPKTASYGPLAALIGLFSLGFFGVLTLATKKS
jgi:hypothetical protein